MARPQDADGSAERALSAGMATLAAAEARLRTARGQLDAATAEALARLVMDLSSALLLVRALAVGEISPDLFRRESGRLALDLPAASPTGDLPAGAKETGAKESGAKESGAKQSGAKQSGAIQSGNRPSGALPTGALLPGGVLDRLPAAARLGALELVTLARALSVTMARLRAGIEAGDGEGTGVNPRQNEKPRRRQGRPRLHVVPGTGPAAV